MSLRKIKIKCLKAAELFVWKKHATHFGAHERSICGIRVLSKQKSVGLVKDAFELIKEFDESMWIRLTSVFYLIIFIEQGQSDIIPSKGVVLISEKSQGHTATSKHLAGWLLYYLELLQGVDEVGLVSWQSYQHSEVRERANSLRKCFIAGISPKVVDTSTSNTPTD